MALKIDIAANTRQAQSQVKDLGESLEDVADALDDVARDADRSGDKLERTFRDMARDAKDADKAVDDIGKTGDSSFRKLGDAGEEVSGELRQNLGETFSSFRGDLEDLPQIAQDTLGGLAGSGALGGIPGLVATAAGAAGLGLLIGALDAAGQKQERLKELASEWADTYIEEGGRVLSFEAQLAKVRDVMTDSYDEAKSNAEAWGVSVETAVAAMAGSESAITEVKDAVADLEQAFMDASGGTGSYTDNMGNVDMILMDMSNKAASARERLGDVTGAMEAGATQADIYSRLMVDMAESTQGATTRVDEFGDKIITLPDGKEVYVDAETGQATSNVDAITNKIYSIPNKDVSVKVQVDDSAWRNWKPQTKVGEVRTISGRSVGTTWE